MLLNEFMYFDKNQAEMQDDERYLSQNDISVIRRTDMRKSRLTLGMINDIRKASEAHDREARDDLDLVRTMYATPAPDVGA